MQLKTYSGEILDTGGLIECTVVYNGKTKAQQEAYVKMRELLTSDMLLLITILSLSWN